MIFLVLQLMCDFILYVLEVLGEVKVSDCFRKFLQRVHEFGQGWHPQLGLVWIAADGMGGNRLSGNRG